jgi:hypothetical protein
MSFVFTDYGRHVLMTWQPTEQEQPTEAPWTMKRDEPCPECGPHGNKGRVLLLESWVDCLTCKLSVPSCVSVGFAAFPKDDE